MNCLNMRFQPALALVVLSQACGGGITDSTIAPLTAVLVAPTSASVGSAVEITMTVTNPSDSTMHLTLALNGGLAFDPVVQDLAGNERWNRLAGLLVAADPETITLTPHEQRTFVATWNTKDSKGLLVPAGTYVIVGRLMGDGKQPLAVAAPQKIILTS